MQKLLFLLSMALLSTVPAINAAVPIKLNLEKGKTYKIKSTSHQNFQRTVNGQQMLVEITSGSFLSFKLLSQEKDVMQIEVKFDTVENKISSPGGKMETNYAKPAKSTDYIGLIRNRYCTFKIIAKISTSGKFLGFANYKTFRDSVLAVMDAVPATKKDQVQKQADDLVKESIIQSAIEPFFNYIPEKEVNTSDKWETSFVQSSSFINLLMSNTFVLNKLENGQAKITGNTEIEALPSTEPPKPGAPQMSTEAKGTATVDLTVDVSIGLMAKSSIKSHLEGVMTMKNQDKETKISMVVDTQSEINKVD
jgi:hypothetical protein